MFKPNESKSKDVNVNPKTLKHLGENIDTIWQENYRKGLSKLGTTVVQEVRLHLTRGNLKVKMLLHS